MHRSARRYPIAAMRSLLLFLGQSSVVASIGTQAFYVLFSDQIRSPNWPQKLCQNNGVGPQGDKCVDASKYENGVFIASPQNMTKDDIAKVKRDVPGSHVIAYFDFGDMPLSNSVECPFCHSHIMGDRPGRNCSTTYSCGPSPFLSGLQHAFPTRLAVHDVTNGSVPGVCVQSYWGLAKYVWNAEGAQILAQFLGEWIVAHGFDGIYLDGYVEPDRVDFHECHLKEEGCQSFIKPGHVYDIDGDGRPETPSEIYGSYFAWGPAFLAMMRRRLGRDAIILANSAGSLSDASLSGVTIEMEACTAKHGGARKCSDALHGQHTATAAAGGTPVSVLWLTHSNSMPAAQQCKLMESLQAQYPYVQAGTDFFDGSHVVC